MLKNALEKHFLFDGALRQLFLLRYDNIRWKRILFEKGI